MQCGFSITFDMVNHCLLLCSLSAKFRGSLLYWMGSYWLHASQKLLFNYNLKLNFSMKIWRPELASADIASVIFLT
jgi:hypothetical protein